MIQAWDTFFESLSTVSPSDDFFFLVIALLSTLFVFFPVILNLYQLHNEIKEHWLNDVYTCKIIFPWLSKNTNMLYLLSIFTGSGFAAIEFCNSNLFQLRMCYMNLPHVNKSKFKNRRLFSVVFFENIPQLILQIAYITFQAVQRLHSDDNESEHNDYTVVTVFAMIFSFLSIILALFEFVTKQYLFSIEMKLFLTLKVASNEIATMTRDEFYRLVECQRLCVNDIIGRTLDIDSDSVELLKPISSDVGVLLIFHIRNNSIDKSKVGKKIQSSIDNQRLQTTLKKIYKLEKKPQITDVKTKVVFGNNVDITSIKAINSKAMKMVSNDSRNNFTRDTMDSVTYDKFRERGETSEYNDNYNDVDGEKPIPRISNRPKPPAPRRTPAPPKRKAKGKEKASNNEGVGHLASIFEHEASDNTPGNNKQAKMNVYYRLENS